MCAHSDQGAPMLTLAMLNPCRKGCMPLRDAWRQATQTMGSSGEGVQRFYRRIAASAQLMIPSMCQDGRI